MPLWTTTRFPPQSVWGCAFSSEGRPWVAQRVCPIPSEPATGRSRRVPSSGRGGPGAGRRPRAPPGAPEAPGGPPHLEPALVQPRDAGGVVAAVLEPLEPFDDDADRALVPDVPHD